MILTYIYSFSFFRLRNNFPYFNKLARHFPSFNSQFISPQVGNIFSQTACLLPIKWTFSKWNDPCAPVLVQIQGCRKGLEGALAPTVFGRTVNPISTRGADYVHYSTTSHLPPGFSDLATALIVLPSPSPCTAGDVLAKRKEWKKACYRTMAAS